MPDVMPPGDPRKPFLDDAERFRLLETNVTDYAIFMIGPDERIASWNSGAERILGYSEAEILDQPASIIFTREDNESGAEQQEFRTARETGRSNDERWHQRKDGSRLWALGILTALYNEQGHLRGYAKILRDFTVRKQHEERIEGLNARLQRTMTETHHRVKNNLQLISAIIEFQALEYGDMVPVAEYKRLGNHVRALAAVHDLLTEDTKAGGDATEISLSALLGKLLSLLQAAAGVPLISYQLEELTVSAHKGSSIALIVNELIMNAIRHGDGSIQVALSAREGIATLSVCEDGPGFPEGFHAERFSKTGLELVENLTRLDLRGEVRYVNRPEGGGCVTIDFRMN